mgnify:CR=1 FL=1
MNPKPMTMAEMTSLARSRGQQIYGFAVSPEIWAGLRPKAEQLTGETFEGLGPHTIKGTPLIVDRKLQPTEFDTAFTALGWEQRLAAFRGYQV